MLPTSDFVWPDAAAAINAATLAAIEKARKTGTNLVVRGDNGKIIEITPDEAEAQFNKDLGKDN
jgi:hypothetical protein